MGRKQRRIRSGTSSRRSQSLALPGAKSRPAPLKQLRKVIRPAVPTAYPYPQPWVLELSGTDRRQKLRQLQADVKALRKIFTGFEAKDGFDARHPENWSAARVAKARRYGVRLHNLQSSPHVIVRPRSTAQREALLRHVAQPWPNLKAFVVHTPHPANTQVEYVREPPRLLPFHVTLPGRVRVQLVKKIRGGAQLTRDYLFREILGYQPGLSGPGGRFRKGRNPWEDMIHATRLMLPYMPDTAISAQTGKPEEAWYTFVSMPHDSIGAAIRKSDLLSVLRSDYSRYSEGFAGLILGFRYQGSRWKAAMSPRSEMNQRDRWKQHYKQEREDTLKALRRMDERLSRSARVFKKKKRKSIKRIKPIKLVKPVKPVKKKRVVRRQTKIKRLVKSNRRSTVRRKK